MILLLKRGPNMTKVRRPTHPPKTRQTLLKVVFILLAIILFSVFLAKNDPMRKRRQRAAALRVRSPESAKDAFAEQQQQQLQQQQQKQVEEREQQNQQEEEDEEVRRVERNEADSGAIHQDERNEEQDAGTADIGPERNAQQLESRTYVFELASLKMIKRVMSPL